MIKVDKGIPAPERENGRPCKYPWRLMNVGDSFFVPGNASGLHSTAKHCGIGIVTRVETVNGEKGVRVWRIADHEAKIRAVK